MIRRFGPLLMFLALGSPAGAEGANGITPSHVYRHVALVRAEVELIRLEMGKRSVDPPAIRVVGAAPREVYFQGLTLIRKADRLAFEHAGERVTEPPIPAGQIEPAHVRAVVDTALKRVRSVKKVLAIAEQSEPPPLEAGIEPSQVLLAIMSANREINQLLDLQFAPGDVYQQVSVAIAYTARLLDSPGKVSTPPAPPPFERRKRPADVFRMLVTCLDDIREVGERSGIPMLQLEVDDQQVDRAEPGDVYDIASLVVAELAHLHGLRARATPPRKAYSPGRKVPSQVYQRLGILCGQLDALRQKAADDPGWLKE